MACHMCFEATFIRVTDNFNFIYVNYVIFCPGPFSAECVILRGMARMLTRPNLQGVTDSFMVKEWFAPSSVHFGKSRN